LEKKNGVSTRSGTSHIRGYNIQYQKTQYFAMLVVISLCITSRRSLPLLSMVTGIGVKQLVKMVDKHKRSHKTAMQPWAEFKLHAKTGATVRSLQNEKYCKLTLENRHYLEVIVKVLRLMASQKITQRGHREGESSSNKGNFFEILHLVADYEDIVQSRLNGPRNARYTHHQFRMNFWKSWRKLYGLK
jgi:hypothetical protein